MKAVLENWDFSDQKLNGSVSLVNRQKSATRLVVLALDRAARSGRFFDREKELGADTTLRHCSCKDFSFVGKSPRKSFKPCMHIYRLAMELGMLEPRYLDHDAREALRVATVGDLKRAEDQRLRALGSDPGAWGGWPTELHASGLQLNRQYRAYFIADGESMESDLASSDPEPGAYMTSLDRCSCPDFQSRHIPCKHVYARAIEQRLPIPLKQSEYLEAKRAGRDVVFEYEVERPDPNRRF
jgi:predicted nucleic acid-binding Zn finger protein